MELYTRKHYNKIQLFHSLDFFIYFFYFILMLRNYKRPVICRIQPLLFLKYL